MPTRFESLVDMQERSCERFAALDLFGTKRAGNYTWMRYDQFARDVDAFRAALDELGVERGDKVAVISDNRVEWAVGAYATYGLGAHYVPMYEAQHPKDWAFILKDSGAKVLLTSSEVIRERAKKVADEVPAVQHVIGFESAPDKAHSYARLLEAGRGRKVPSVKPHANETAGLIYTSGTMGNPKGVVLSHGNFVSNINAVHQIFPMGQGDISCSFLPWAHSFGQTAELHVLLSMGCSIGIAESVPMLMENLLEIRPTVLLAVPRIFEKIYDGLRKRMADESPRKRKIFERGIEVASRRRELAEKNERSLWLEAQFVVFEKLVFSKIKERFGGRLRYVISGGAALSKEVGEFIDNIGITVFEGYGLTETSPVVSTNTPDARRLGTVGRPIPGVDVFICDEHGKVLPAETDGEVVVVGPNVMQGYHGREAETAEVIFELDGMRAFRTGDMGRLTTDGFLKITGRFKEQYKLGNGKYVVPTPLEEKLKLSGFINQAFIFGDNKPFNVCLVVPDMPAVEKWAKQQGIAGDKEALLANARVHAKIGEEIERQAATFKGYERPTLWVLIGEEFSVENDLLTPKMSVKRRNVVARYRELLDGLYVE
jgi:long-chain acyl-CoA synthetase